MIEEFFLIADYEVGVSGNAVILGPVALDRLLLVLVQVPRRLIQAEGFLVQEIGCGSEGTCAAPHANPPIFTPSTFSL